MIFDTGNPSTSNYTSEPHDWSVLAFTIHEIIHEEETDEYILSHRQGAINNRVHHAQVVKQMLKAQAHSTLPLRQTNFGKNDKFGFRRWKQDN